MNQISKLKGKIVVLTNKVDRLGKLNRSYIKQMDDLRAENQVLKAELARYEERLERKSKMLEEIKSIPTSKVIYKNLRKL